MGEGGGKAKALQGLRDSSRFFLLLSWPLEQLLVVGVSLEEIQGEERERERVIFAGKGRFGVRALRALFTRFVNQGIRSLSVFF